MRRFGGAAENPAFPLHGNTVCFLWCLTTRGEDGPRDPSVTIADAIVVYHLVFAEHRWAPILAVRVPHGAPNNCGDNGLSDNRCHMCKVVGALLASTPLPSHHAGMGADNW